MAEALLECKAALKRGFYLSRETFAEAGEVGALDAVDTKLRAVFGEGPRHDVPDGRDVVDFFDRIIEVLGGEFDSVAEEYGWNAPVEGRG